MSGRLIKAQPGYAKIRHQDERRGGTGPRVPAPRARNLHFLSLPGNGSRAVDPGAPIRGRED